MWLIWCDYDCLTMLKAEEIKEESEEKSYILCPILFLKYQEQFLMLAPYFFFHVGDIIEYLMNNLFKLVVIRVDNIEHLLNTALDEFSIYFNILSPI